ncbi:MAG: hypothetical protein K2L39_08265 [Muribaculaceae bacterium]|nr:hypothetical protein [Muribaculaceae bacterium]
MKRLKIFISLLAGLLGFQAILTSCIEDGVSTSASDQPAFSTDTVRMGSLLTLGPSPTNRFIVYNRHGKVMNISDIAFRDDDAGQFRINVDGMSGRRFSNVEIRPNDSIFVFVEATLAENGKNLPVEVLAHIDFRVNGVTSSMPVKAYGQDVTRLSGDTRFSGTASLSPDRPYLVNDSIVVEEGATLTLPAGTRLMMHDRAEIIVHGTLLVNGTVENPVEITGDRSGFVAASIPYEVMSGQWGGIRFSPTSSANEIHGASIRNSERGIVLDHCGGSRATPALVLHNSVVRNTKNYVVEAVHSSLTAVGCELSDASLGILRLVGSEHLVSHCTLGNYYLFTAIGGPALRLEHVDPEEETDDTEDSELPWMSDTEIHNTIIYGLGPDLSHGDLEGLPVTLLNCLLKSAGSDDQNFINCLWDTDPLFGVDRDNYIFDYRVGADSPAIGAGDTDRRYPLAETDMLGAPRLPLPTVGAYQEAR